MGGRSDRVVILQDLPCGSGNFLAQLPAGSGDNIKQLNCRGRHSMERPHKKRKPPATKKDSETFPNQQIKYRSNHMLLFVTNGHC